MMRKRNRRSYWMLFILLTASLLLSACSSGAAETAVDPNLIYTQAAGTVQAQLTAAAAKLPTATETPEPTLTEEPTATSEPTEIPPTLTSLATLPVETLPAAATVQPAFPTATQIHTVQGDGALFQYSNPADGSTFSPGEEFLLSWGFKNIGTTTWTTDYKWIWIGGVQFSSVLSGNLEQTVAPGEKGEFNLWARAPSEPGKYISRWKLVNAQGVYIEEYYYPFTVSE